MDYRHPSDDFVQEIDIHTLLPQKEPFVMVGQLIHFDERQVATRTLIAPDNILVEDGKFSVAGLTENIAQTCAARIGYANVYIYKRSVQTGVIGAVRNMQVDRLPIVGSQITTIVNIREEVMSMTLADAVVYQDEQPIAQTEIKIALHNSEAQQ
mgnify:CR=1 FL=1